VLFQEHNCALTAACHDSAGSSANFSMASLSFSDIAGWRERLVGKYPKGGGIIASMCGGSQQPYLVSGSSPATGLFLSKLRNVRPPCGDQMPSLPPSLTASELDCVQRWANQLTAGTPTIPIPDSMFLAACPITCGAGAHCVNYATSPEVVGRFICTPIPQLCEGVPNCGCVTNCAQCRQVSNYLRCAEGG
jgi:hypothetical protein